MAEPARKLPRHRPSRRPHIVDRVARGVITGGGVLIILSVIGIIAFILLEAFPLFQGARVEREAVAPPPSGGPAVLAASTEEYKELLFEVLGDGRVVFRRLPGGEEVSSFSLEGTGGAALTAAAIDTDRSWIAWGTEEGRAGLAEARFATEFLPEGGRDITPSLHPMASLDLDPDGSAVELVAGSRGEEGGVTLAAMLEDGSLRVGLRGAEGERARIYDLTERLEVAPTALALAQTGDRILVGTARGELFSWALSRDGELAFDERVGVTKSPGIAVTCLAFLLGGQSVVVGGEDGGLAVWSRVPVEGEEAGWRLREIHTFPRQSAAVVSAAFSPRDKGFLTADAAGNVRLHYSTSERTLATMRPGVVPESVALSPRADGALALGPDGTVHLWSVHNPHPEISLQTLFGKVWYEGLSEPAWVWQSSGATDDFEPKLSLVPLLFGTIKGAVYAMLFSIPIALLGAIYTAQFAHPRVKQTVKPFVEILAALPSVIIGFLAGLWLAPLLIRILPGVTLMIGLVPLSVLGAVFLWELLPLDVRKRLPRGGELFFIMVIAATAAAISLTVGPWVERMVLGGDVVLWLRQTTGLVYDQRNCVVVGFALGFAVIPIIFTIAEDALSSVPRHLVSASLALGATRWTTTWRVVIPTASAGIFAAVMLGFGRAVGETMIVLMATGNTPILDWNIFNGMRTLSANIAVEIPEAPHQGTLYRVLFLSAALLFVLTFLTNTVAEVVGHRLRKKYQRL